MDNIRSDWTTVGEELVTPELRPTFLAAREKMVWENLEDIEGEVPMSQGMALQEVIREFQIPRVSSVSYRCDQQWAGHALLGLVCHYRNADVTLYVIDTGATVVPILSRVREIARAEPL